MNASWTLYSALAALASCLGCSVNAELSSSRLRVSQNTCSVETTCGNGGSCVEGICRASASSFARALFEVSFPANAADGAGARFYLANQALPAMTGRLDLETQGLVRIAGRVRPQFSAAQVALGCGRAYEDSVSGEFHAPGVDQSVPVRVSLSPVERVLGLNTQTYSAKTSAVQASDAGHEFVLLVPPGGYDIYIQPYKATVQGCAVPPVNLRRDFAGDTMVSLELAAPEPLALRVRYSLLGCETSSCRSLEGWVAEVVEEESGRVLSTRAQLSDLTSTVSGTTREYAVEFNVSAAGPRELVRLSPPDGVVAPVLYVDRSGLELFQKGQGHFDVPSQRSAAVTVAGLVEGTEKDALDARGTFASLTFVATELVGFAGGMLAAFSRTVATDERGSFTAELLPGSYEVRAIPGPESPFAATTLNWSVGETPDRQTGKIIDVKPKVTIQGFVLDLQGAEAQGMSVHVVPAANMQSITGLARLLGQEPVAPRGGTVTLDMRGTFVLATDPGRYDISIRPPESSQLAWLVLPKLNVAPPGLDLQQLTLPLPLVFSGEVRAGAAGPVPGALVRAYLYVDAEGRSVDVPGKAISVVEVAESRADSSGHFNLLVPVKLN